MTKLFTDAAMEEIREKTEEWRNNAFTRSNHEMHTFETVSGIPVEPLYTPSDIKDFDYGRDSGFPGSIPFIRGVYPTMYRGRTWTLRQLAGFGSPEESNKRFKFLLKEGATGINSVFDFPTLRGYDSTHPHARADAGRGGVSIDTLQDMSILFEDIPIDSISTSLVTCQPICNIIIQSMFFSNALKRGIRMGQLAGTSQNDFLMETAITIAPETLPPKASFRICCDAIEFCSKFAPRWNPISFAGYNYRESGCNAIQEIALVIANAMACAEELISRGLEIDQFAPRFSFFLSAHNDFFEEICKFRAARRIWSRIIADRFKTQNPRSMTFRFHVQTAGAALTAQQPLNNIARAAYHALAAALGGAQSVHVDAYDEALCIPTELSSLTALRTNQILQTETQITHTTDPLGGSYFIESMTNQLETKILAYIEAIENIGGVVKAVESGWIHREISDSAYHYQRKIESGEIKVVGVNCFQQDEEELPIVLFDAPETLSIQARKISEVKQNRDPRHVQKALDAIRSACDQGRNLMPIMMESVEAYLTEGEIADVLKEQFGIWHPPLF